MSTITAKIQLRAGTAAEWNTANPVLAAGEAGYDLTAGQIRVGNGVTPWSGLTPFNPGVTSGGGGAGSSPTVVVASAISPPKVKARADYVCDGTNDADVINNAIKAADNQIQGGSSGNKYGSVTLADGVYVLNKPILMPGRGFTLSGQGYGTILMKAASFTNGGAGTTPAVIKADSSASGQAGCFMTIRDMSIIGRNFGTFGTGSASGSAIGGIRLEIVGPTQARANWGYPNPVTNGDNNTVIARVQIYDTTTAFFWSSTNGARGVRVVDCGAYYYAGGGIGFHISASDAKLSNCVSGPSSGPNSKGFLINGGNTMLNLCKAFYVLGSGSMGFDVQSSRISLTGCESQDNNIGFQVTGNEAKLTGIRVDNQEIGCATALDLASADNFMCQGIYVQTRGDGTYARGINLPSGTNSGFIDAFIKPTNITTPLTKGTTPVAITDNAGMPANVEARILIGGVGTRRKAL